MLVKLGIGAVAPQAMSFTPSAPPVAPAKPAPPADYVAGGSPASPGVQVDSAAIEQSLRSLREAGDTQFTLEGVPPPEPPPAWLEPILEFLGSIFGWIGPFLNILFWVALVAFGLFLLYLFLPGFRNLIDAYLYRRRRRQAAEEVEADHWAPDYAAARDLLAEADALARDGRFAEAVHLLLGRSIEDIERRRPGALRPAFTSRTIARLEALPAAVRGAFADLAAVVERAVFARRPIDGAQWADARDAYGRFALRDQWGAQP